MCQGLAEDEDFLTLFSTSKPEIEKGGKEEKISTSDLKPPEEAVETMSQDLAENEESLTSISKYSGGFADLCIFEIPKRETATSVSEQITQLMGIKTEEKMESCYLEQPKEVVETISEELTKNKTSNIKTSASKGKAPTRGRKTGRPRGKGSKGKSEKTENLQIEASDSKSKSLQTKKKGGQKSVEDKIPLPCTAETIGDDDDGDNCKCYIHLLFFGILQQELCCQECGKKNVKLEDFSYLSLSLDSSSWGAASAVEELSLTECINTYMGSENFEFFCEECNGKKTQCEKVTKMHTAPVVMCFHFERLGSIRGKKNETYVSFPERLNLLPYICEIEIPISEEEMEISTNEDGEGISTNEEGEDISPNEGKEGTSCEDMDLMKYSEGTSTAENVYLEETSTAENVSLGEGTSPDETICLGKELSISENISLEEVTSTIQNVSLEERISSGNNISSTKRTSISENICLEEETSTDVIIDLEKGISENCTECKRIMEKISGRREFIPIFDDNLSPMGISESTYSLLSVIVHTGTEISGHYVAYIKAHGKWFLCNDERVSEVTTDVVLNSNAYLLFYQKDILQYEEKPPDKLYKDMIQNVLIQCRRTAMLEHLYKLCAFKIFKDKK